MMLLEVISTGFTPNTQELVNTYISIRVLSVPAELIIYILVGFYLGIQKTNLSSLLVITMSILNIVLSSFFVFKLKSKLFFYGVY